MANEVSKQVVKKSVATGRLMAQPSEQKVPPSITGERLSGSTKKPTVAKAGKMLRQGSLLMSFKVRSLDGEEIVEFTPESQKDQELTNWMKGGFLIVRSKSGRIVFKRNLESSQREKPSEEEPSFLTSLKKGIEQSKAGKTIVRPSYAKYAR